MLELVSTICIKYHAPLNTSLSQRPKTFTIPLNSATAPLIPLLLHFKDVTVPFVHIRRVFLAQSLLLLLLLLFLNLFSFSLMCKSNFPVLIDVLSEPTEALSVSLPFQHRTHEQFQRTSGQFSAWYFALKNNKNPL